MLATTPPQVRRRRLGPQSVLSSSSELRTFAGSGGHSSVTDRNDKTAGQRPFYGLFLRVSTVSRPVGGVLSSGPLRGSRWVTIHLCGLPGDIDRAGRPTLGLAPGGVCRAARVTPSAGALLPHRFTLACEDCVLHRRSVLCGTFLRVTPTGR